MFACEKVLEKDTKTFCQSLILQKLSGNLVARLPHFFHLWVVVLVVILVVVVVVVVVVNVLV